MLQLNLRVVFWPCFSQVSAQKKFFRADRRERVYARSLGNFYRIRVRLRLITLTTSAVERALPVLMKPPEFGPLIAPALPPLPVVLPSTSPPLLSMSLPEPPLPVSAPFAALSPVSAPEPTPFKTMARFRFFTKVKPPQQFWSSSSLEPTRVTLELTTFIAPAPDVALPV